MYPSLIEFLCVVLFLGCLGHSLREQGGAFAQQWFVGGYLFGIIREGVMQVVFQSYHYAPGMLWLGAAPALVSLLWSAIFYLAYQFARRFVVSRDLVRMGALLFAIAASLILPIEATAAQLGWWVYEEPGLTVFGQMPLRAPLVWGGAAVLFYLLFARIRASRLPDRGRLYAMITFSPVIAGLHVLYTLVLNAVL